MTTQDILTFHHQFFPSHPPTPLHPLPTIPTRSSSKSTARFYLKDESSRCGLPAFKILGASWALCSVLGERWGVNPGDRDGLKRAAIREREGGGLRVYAATDGNHGRAVAHTCQLVGIDCTIYVPASVANWSIAAIRREGATVIVHDGDYDSTVKAAADAAEKAGERGLLIQDTSWEGYTDIPMRIVNGYTKLFHELSTQLSDLPTHIIVPVGVGSLAHAAVLYAQTLPNQPRIITVEPSTAACLHTSLVAAQHESPDSPDYAPTSIQTGNTIMPGLNCGTVSTLAWPDLRRYVRVQDALVISDGECRRAMEELETAGYRVGPCGAAAYAAAGKVEWEDESRVVLICTEGPEDTA